MMNKYYWRHYSANNVYEVYYLELQEKRYWAHWNFFFVGADKSIMVGNNPDTSVGKEDVETNWKKMDKFPFEEAPYIFKAIFNNLKVNN